MTDTLRAIAIGIPDRMHRELEANLPGVRIVYDELSADEIVAEYPHVAVLYGEHTFGPAVSGQRVLVLPEQHDARRVERVVVVTDAMPTNLNTLAMDDPRRLAPQAGVRLAAGYLVDVSQPGVWVALDVLLDDIIDTPPAKGVSSGDDGND